MGVFVKNRLQRIRAVFCQRKHDEVLVAPAMKKARKINRLSLIKRHETLERFMVRQSDHLNGWRGHGLSSRQGFVGHSELLEPRSKPCDFLSQATAIGLKMGRPRREPMTANQGRQLFPPAGR